jgi:Peptidase M15
MSDIRATFLSDAAKYFDGLEHQAYAFDWLQSQIPPDKLEEFASKFSPATPPLTGGASSESIKKRFDPARIDWSDFNCLISEYFTVGEVTKGDSDRVPEKGSDEERNILALAKELDKLRKSFGHPIGVSSWYRPPAVNRQVGGARYSQHINGRGVDIYPMAGMTINDFQEWCDEHWYGALGYGAHKGFVHLDTRTGKGFDAGGEKGARWNY